MSLSTSYLPSTPGITLPRLYKQRFKPTVKPMISSMEEELNPGGTSQKPSRQNLVKTSSNSERTSEKPVMTSHNPVDTTLSPVMTSAKPIMTNVKPVVVSSQTPERSDLKVGGTSGKPRTTNHNARGKAESLEKTSAPMENFVEASTPVPYLDGPYRDARYDFRLSNPISTVACIVEI